MAKAAIGLGSNLANPKQQVLKALEALGALPETTLLARSRLYGARPQGPQDQPDYVNACAIVETRLSPDALLAALQQLEMEMGKVKKRHWGERVIDLDLLLYDQQVVQTPNLTVPHPWLHQRDFVLIPLAEIAPDWQVPGKGSVQSLLATLLETFIERCLDENP